MILFGFYLFFGTMNHGRNDMAVLEACQDMTSVVGVHL